MKFCHSTGQAVPPSRPQCSPKPLRAKGFTLIEVMVVVAIIGILMAIAIPSYQRHVWTSKRAQAKACMSQIAQAMERRYTTALSYAGNVPVPACTTESGLDNHYAIVTAIPDGASYSITAAPIGTQQLLDTECATLTLNQLGATTATGTVPDSCW